nr:hypothetical protein [Actinomadura madurae]
MSIARLGPRRSKWYDSRFAAMECAVPVAAYTSTDAGSFSWRSP